MSINVDDLKNSGRAAVLHANPSAKADAKADAKVAAQKSRQKPIKANKAHRLFLGGPAAGIGGAR